MSRDDRPETRPLDRPSGETPLEPAAPAETRSLQGMQPVTDAGDGADRGPKRPSRLVTALASLGGGLLLSAGVGLLLQELVARVLAAGLWYHWATLGGLALLLLAAVVLVARELRGLLRLQRLSDLHRRARSVLQSDGTDDALLAGLQRLYRDRPDLEWALAEERERARETAGGADRLVGFERHVLAPLDDRAAKAIAAAVRRAGGATAVSPFAGLDMLITAAIDLRLVGTVARIYGGRPGGLASLRLLRIAFANVLVSGGLDTLEDSLGDLVGAGVATRLSSRAGSAVINGLLTARLGLAAADVCRPLPWHARPRPTARGLARQALTGSRSDPSA